MLTGQIFNGIDLKSLIIYIPGLSFKIENIDFVMSPKVNRMDLFLQLIMALAVARMSALRWLEFETVDLTQVGSQAKWSQQGKWNPRPG